MNEAPKQRKTAHITYKDYRKRVCKKSNQGMVIFVSAFFIMLLIFLGIAKQVSPDVDVAIGDNEMPREEIVKSSVDDRLKLIHMEDNAITASDATFSPELDEKVRLPKSAVKRNDLEIDNSDWVELSAANKKVEDEDNELKAESKSSAQTEIDETMQRHQEIISSLNNMKPTQTQVAKNIPSNLPKSVQQIVANPVQGAPTPASVPVKAISAKVIVGNYSSMEQAQVAKGIIAEAGLNIDPFVRSLNGAYTIQVGSFSSREKAQAAANELLRNNFPAKVIVEQ